MGIAVAAEVAGGHAAVLEENAVEGALVLEAAGIGNLVDGLVGGKQLGLGAIDAVGVEQRAEIAAEEPGGVGSGCRWHFCGQCAGAL